MILSVEYIYIIMHLSVGINVQLNWLKKKKDYWLIHMFLFQCICGEAVYILFEEMFALMNSILF